MSIRLIAYENLAVIDDVVIEPHTGPAGNGVVCTTEESIHLRQGLDPVHSRRGPLQPLGADRKIPAPTVGEFVTWNIPGTRMTIFVLSEAKATTQRHF